jgi:hypothetical protein
MNLFQLRTKYTPDPTTKNPPFRVIPTQREREREQHRERERERYQSAAKKSVGSAQNLKNYI